MITFKTSDPKYKIHSVFFDATSVTTNTTSEYYKARGNINTKLFPCTGLIGIQQISQPDGMVPEPPRIRIRLKTVQPLPLFRKDMTHRLKMVLNPYSSGTIEQKVHALVQVPTGEFTSAK